MKLKNAKTCNGCRALRVNGDCGIGFENRDVAPKPNKLGIKKLAPSEPCYKPTTIQESLDAFYEINKGVAI